jgi:hypothetical protein
VYLAFDPTLRREVAVKVPRPDRLETPADRARFLNEARAAALIRHPNVVPVFEVGEVEGTPFIVMEYVPGPTLAEVITDSTTPLPLREAVGIVRSLALAVQAAHDRGVIHRDLKPGNVLLDPERNEYLIADFGLARVSDPGNPMASTHAMAGTPGYMPPEQIRSDQRKIGPRSDVYALGVMLFEVLTGRLPFASSSIADIISRVLTTPPPPPSTFRPDLPPELDAICNRAMAKEPADRYPSARDLADALAPFAAPPAPTRAEPPPTRRAALWATTTTTVALACWMVYKSFFQEPDSGAVPKPDEGRPKPPAAVPDPHPGFRQESERRAAEWVLRSGGAVEIIEPVNGTETRSRPASPDRLPTAFRVAHLELGNPDALTDDAVSVHLAGLTGPVGVNLRECPKLTDAGVAALAGIPNLVWLRVAHTLGVGDAGVKPLAAHAALRHLLLVNTAITPAALADLARTPRFLELGIPGHALDDDWLSAVGRLNRLEFLDLGWTLPGGGITAKGLARLAGLERLTCLNLDFATLAPGGLRALPAFPRLRELSVKRTTTADDDLPSVARLPRLRVLALDGTTVGDAGLQTLAACRSLRAVSLGGTNVTAEGVRRLQTTLPDCRVVGAPG